MKPQFLRFVPNERVTNLTSFWTQFILFLSLIMIGVWTWRLHQQTCQRDGWAARSLLKTLNLLLPTVKTFVSRLNLPSEFQIPSVVFFYSGKSWNGKNLSLAIWKVYHLDDPRQCLSLSFDKNQIVPNIQLPIGIFFAKATFFRLEKTPSILYKIFSILQNSLFQKCKKNVILTYVFSNSLLRILALEFLWIHHLRSKVNHM